jgi:hypothetical protein
VQLDFKKDNVEKQYSSFMLPKIITIDNSANEKYSNNQCCKKLMDANVDLNQIRRCASIVVLE